MRNVVLMGPPGSGKGTQAARLAETYGFVHVSTGEILRSAVRSGDELGRKVESILAAGDFVPDPLMMDLIRETLTAVPETAAGWLLDGFPRTIPQAEGLADVLREGGITEPLVIEITVPDEELVERLSGRVSCRGCSKVFAKGEAIPGEACAHCGGVLYVRDDDKPETVRNRLRLFHEKTGPVRDVLAAQWTFVSVDGNGTPADVLQRINGVLEAEH